MADEQVHNEDEAVLDMMLAESERMMAEIEQNCMPTLAQLLTADNPADQRELEESFDECLDYLNRQPWWKRTFHWLVDLF